jgi:hypothetical protein
MCCTWTGKGPNPQGLGNVPGRNRLPGQAQAGFWLVERRLRTPTGEFNVRWVSEGLRGRPQPAVGATPLASLTSLRLGQVPSSISRPSTARSRLTRRRVG